MVLLRSATSIWPGLLTVNRECLFETFPLASTMSLPDTRPIVISSLSKVRSLGSPFFSVSVSLIMEPREGVQLTETAPRDVILDDSRGQESALGGFQNTLPAYRSPNGLTVSNNGLMPYQGQQRRRENRQNSARRQRRDSARDDQRNPITLHGRRRGFVLGPSRHRGQYTSKLALRSYQETRHDAMDMGAVGGAGRGDAGGSLGSGFGRPEVLLSAPAGQSRSGGRRHAQELHGRRAKGRAGVASRVGLGHRSRRSSHAGQRPDRLGGRAEEAPPARVRRHG